MTVIAADSTAQAKGRAGLGRISTSAAVTCGLALFLLFNGLVLNSVLRSVAPEGYRETVFDHTRDVLYGEGCDDSWGIMSKALDYLNAPHTVPLYTEIFFNRKMKIHYPPSSLFTL